ncbi:MAG TPA: primosomal protein N' [Candidatus Hydrogenedentes bacterium]|nr:primosomal protein N' [Candidatus Hydrogenedentota bacterium]
MDLFSSTSPAVKVALPLSLDKVLTWLVPPELVDKARPGMRALVPIQSRIVLGIIVEVLAESDVQEARTLIDIPDHEPVLDKNLLRLCKWIADYYCCSWGEALFSALPSSLKAVPKKQYYLNENKLDSGRLSEMQRKIVGALYRQSPQTVVQLSKSVGTGALQSALRSLLSRKIIFEDHLFQDRARSILTETRVSLAADAPGDPETLQALQKKAPKQAALYLELLYGEKEQSADLLCRKHNTTKSTFKSLEKRGWVHLQETEVYRRPSLPAGFHAKDKFKLNEEQLNAYNAMCTPLLKREYHCFLLHGITGSGKTEVYLQIIEKALSVGRTALMLVPEISLTPQTVGRFYARFNQDIAVFHSGLSEGERYDAWRRTREGKVRIVVGARSAIFAPLQNIAVIVVDEEHDHSYKQGEAPRYHGRDVAIVRARMENALCVLGSATPSVESFYNSEQKKSSRLVLLNRATTSSLPEVRIIDMRREVAETPGQLILSTELEKAVQKRVAANEQVILLLNRRGFAPVVLCPVCGWIPECDNCQVSLTYHRAGGNLLCHYCNTSRSNPLVCSQCGFNPLLYLGAGTQKAEDYLVRSFSGARVERMDGDTTSGKGGHANILERFARREIDILIGTQMLAKGHDYPGVTLVGVINADAGLTIPDFRAAEQSFQLLTQVAGRAGRGSLGGEVIIQTHRPQHYAVQSASRHDYAAFYAHEIQQREAAGYPPFRRLVNFLIEGEDPLYTEKASLLLRRLALAQADEMGFHGIAFLGPAPASVRRVKKIYRWNFALMSRSAARVNALSRALREVFENNAPEGNIRLKIDLDPYGMF